MSSPLIFGFGSLIDDTSRLATVSDATTARAAYIKGFIRKFNLWDSLGWTETNLDVAGLGFCAVDIQAVLDQELKVNGVVFEVSELHSAALAEREHEYQLIETTAYDFVTNEVLGECEVFSANKNNGTYDFGSEAQKRYLELCLNGARKYGEDFCQEFLRTTFIGGERLDEIATLLETVLH